jgi:hypothetical protein
MSFDPMKTFRLFADSVRQKSTWIIGMVQFKALMWWFNFCSGKIAAIIRIILFALAPLINTLRLLSSGR